MDTRQHMTASTGHAIAKCVRMARASALLALMALGLAGLYASAPLAQTTFSFRARSYINPFPQTDRYHLHVFGDYLADGLAAGLTEAFENEASLKIIDSTKSSAGLARPERTDWAADVAELAQSQRIHIAVLMMGINDVRSIRLPSGRVKWGTEAWREAYAQQVDQLIRALKERNIAVYWVGMPIMAKSSTSEAMALINDIVRERSYINGTKFIDTWTGFTDQLGGYSSYGPDLTGQQKRLRDSNGITFTSRGNRKLANYAEVILRRDLASARRERNISLAGDSEEQQRLVPESSGGWGARTAEAGRQSGDEDGNQAQSSGTPAPGTDAAQTIEDASSSDAGAPARAGPDGPGEDASGSAASVFASGYSPPGETILGDISEGVTGLATVSPVSDLSVDPSERRLPVTQRLYYKLLVEGEALKPKPDRADDFQWPRS